MLGDFPSPQDLGNLIPSRFLWIFFVFICIGVMAVVVWFGYFEPKTRTVTGDENETAIEQISQTLTLELKDIESLDSGHYVAWVSDGITSWKAGSFRLRDDGVFVDLDGNVVSHNEFVFAVDRGRILSRIFVTIEANDDQDDSPSETEIVTGSLERGGAQLSFSAVDLVESRGSYILLTPTDDPNKDFERSGLWFFTPVNPFRTSLVLNDAPRGWMYEGWVIRTGETISLGRFRSIVGRDSFHGFSGDAEGPAFPGEDLLRNAPEGFPGGFPINLADGSSEVFITLEPDYSGIDPTGDKPFHIRALSDEIPEGLADRIPEIFHGFSRASFPSGTATLK
ncbi:MAG: hypothetical protein V1685_05850 [Parcubacteria group bacterium]